MLRAGEDYLETILQIEGTQEKSGVRITDIARKLEVTKPSVIRAMKQLAAEGYIEQEAYGDIFLTEKGRLKASQVLHRHAVLTSFVRDILCVSPEQAEKDACLIEHYISAESMEKLSAFVDAEAGKDL